MTGNKSANIITNTVYEIALKTGGSSSYAFEILSGLFANCGVPYDKLVQLSVCGQAVVSYYSPSRTEVSELYDKLRRFGLKKVVVVKRSIARRDWQDKWKDNICPFLLGKTFQIIPTWRRRSYKKSRGRMPVFISSDLAFGTGLHETTRFMANIIEMNKNRVSTFLDIGTGTGILSIIATKCGATEILAIDNDPGCIKVAQENLRLNRCVGYELMECDFRKFSARKKFDFVSANLFTNNLLELGRKICSRVKPGGRLAISGVSIENLEGLKNGFKKYPLRCLKVLKGRKWSALLYKRLQYRRYQ